MAKIAWKEYYKLESERLNKMHSLLMMVQHERNLLQDFVEEKGLMDEFHQYRHELAKEAEAKKETNYNVRLMYDGRYQVIGVKAANQKEAVKIIESMIDTAKEYRIMSIS